MSKFYHTLDPDDIREMEEQERRDLEDAERAADLLREDMMMERYYERKASNQ